MLIDSPRDIDLLVFFGSEHGFERVDLLLGEQVRSGEQDTAYAIEGIPGTVPVPECLLLDPLPTVLHTITDQSHDVEWIDHRDDVGKFVGRC